ncbi:MAG: hypothetical protein HY749_04280 [Gammaproteobacteria bacterium]|nr:hypothetical protein [Gammaproteobacteria bacterium]MBI5614988.1 hypothetical protein [Gammaproteobacteria bacterium]
MNPRWEEAQDAFLRAWSTIVQPVPGGTAGDNHAAGADWLKAAWREAGAGAPAFADAYRRFGEWLGAGLAGSRGRDPGELVAAMTEELKKHIDALLARPASVADAGAATAPSSPWERFAEAFGGGRWPPEAVFAQTWFDVPGYSRLRRQWQDGAQAWLRQQAAAVALQRRQLAGMKDALDRFAARLTADGDDTATITSLRALFELWIECAEEAHQAMIAGEDYDRDFGAFVNAGAALRKIAGEAVADFFAALDVPARRDASPGTARAPAGEAAELERRLQDTLREMAAMRGALAAAEARAAATRPRPKKSKKAAPVKKAAKKPATARKKAARPQEPARREPATAARGERVADEFDIAAIGARRS